MLKDYYYVPKGAKLADRRSGHFAATSSWESGGDKYRALLVLSLTVGMCESS